MKRNFKFFVTTLILVTTFSFTFFSCRTAELAVNSDLKKEAEVYAVKGKQGSQIGQVLSFGDYKTSKVKRGWTSGYSVPFIIKFQGAREKLSFSQFDVGGNSAEVALVSRFKETEYEPIKDYFSIALKYKNYFAGAVKINNNDETWDFIVHNVDGANRNLKRNSSAGFVTNHNTIIEITGILELEGTSTFMTQNNVYGYEFRLDGKIVGTVATINNGKVWLKKDLPAEIKLVLASVSSGLLLRNNVEENTLSMN